MRSDGNSKTRVRLALGKARSGLAVLDARLRGRRRPVVVGWAVTRRCNYHCPYCGEWSGPPELDTDQALALIDQLAAAGTRVLGLTGGEPLVREDLDALVARARRRRLLVTLATNGALLPERLDALSGLHRVSISLEGPREVHDALRGPGAFQRAVEAVEAARRRGLAVELTATLNAHNVHRVAEVVELARRLESRVTFQPATAGTIRGAAPNPVAPDPAAYRDAVQWLARQRRRRGSPVTNSAAGLRHLQRWPADAWLACSAGHIACKITPSGDVFHCGRYRATRPEQSAVRHGFAAAFRSLPAVGCHQCWCAARVEMNLLYQLDLEALWGMLLR